MPRSSETSPPYPNGLTARKDEHGFRRDQSTRHSAGARRDGLVAEFVRAISFQSCAALLAVAAILHDLSLTERFNGENRFEVDGANAAREFLKERGISAQRTQLAWDAIALHTTPTLALHKEPEVVMTHSGIAVDVLGAGLDRISREKQQAILTAFPRLAFKDGFKGCLCNVVRQKPMTAVDNILRDFGIRYVEGFTPPNFADLVAGAPFSE